MYDAFLPASLAMFHYAANHSERKWKLGMDGSSVSSSDFGGLDGLPGSGYCCTFIWMGITVDIKKPWLFQTAKALNLIFGGVVVEVTLDIDNGSALVTGTGGQVAQ